MPSTSIDRVTGISTSVAVKAPVRVATTAAITLSGLQTIDAITVVAGDRILVKDQTNTAQNGIYVAAVLTWTRAEDFDAGDDVVSGTVVYVRQGTANSSNWFQATVAAVPTLIGTTAITWAATYVSLTVVTQATESSSGIAELATQAETNTGSDDLRIVTPLKLKTSVFNSVGKQKLPLMAASMQPATTNGAAAGAVETTTNKVLYRTLDFDQTTQELAGFVVPMPKGWNEGTVTFRAIWTAASGTGGVTWGLAGLARSDDDPIDTAYSSAVTSTDTLLSTGDAHRSPESSALTIAGTPATDDTVFFRVSRVVADAGDTLTGDARLIGIELYITTDAGTEA